jgi:hypothetical protein
LILENITKQLRGANIMNDSVSSSRKLQNVSTRAYTTNNVRQLWQLRIFLIASFRNADAKNGKAVFHLEQ